MGVCVANAVVNLVKDSDTKNTAVNSSDCHVMCTNVYSIGNKLCEPTMIT